LFGLNGTRVQGGEVENSNTDISDQFSKLIMTQQAYTSNTKVLSTANEMLQDAINILR
jgi:flagellar hook protein FlgE